MKKLSFLIALLFMTLTSYAQTLTADHIIGTWLSEDSEVKLKFEIFKSEGKYFGRLLWASDMFEADGKTSKKDEKNPDPKLRSRARQNIVNVTNLTYKDGEYTGGKIYVPVSGDSYSLNAKLININEMHFRAYMGVSFMGKTIE